MEAGRELCSSPQGSRPGRKRAMTYHRRESNPRFDSLLFPRAQGSRSFLMPPPASSSSNQRPWDVTRTGRSATRSRFDGRRPPGEVNWAPGWRIILIPGSHYWMATGIRTAPKPPGAESAHPTVKRCFSPGNYSSQALGAIFWKFLSRLGAVFA